MSTVRSRKNKGKRLQNTVTLKLREIFKDILVDGDIQSQTMGMIGVDVVLSPSAKNIIPYDIECKNNEAILSSVMREALIQAEENTETGRISLLIFKSNNEPERVVIKLDDFLDLIFPQKSVILNADKQKRLLIQIEQLKQAVLSQSKEQA